VSLIKGDELVQFLNSCDNNAGIRIFKLLLQNPRRCVAVRRALFKTVVLFHRLVIQVFAVNDKQHLVNKVQPGGELRRLKAGQRLAAAGRVPDVAARVGRSRLFIIGRNHNAVDDPLGRRDLIGTHDEQEFLVGEHAIAGQDIEQRVPGEKCLCEVYTF